MIQKKKSIGYPDIPVGENGKNMFQTNTYVDVLTDFIQTCDTPMTIAIQGDWGTGKTSMMNLIKGQLGANVKSVMFNTWQYSQFNLGDQLPILLINNLVNSLSQDETVKKDIKDKMKWGAKLMGNLALGYLSGGAVSADFSEFNLDQIEMLINMKESFKKIVNEAAAQVSGRVVVFVDDLDRLQPQKAVEVLEVLKVFLDCENCVFVLAVDYSVVSKGVSAKYGEDMDDEKGRSFFDKIIQLPFKMPVAQYAIDDYLKGLMSHIWGTIEKDEHDDIKNYLKVIECTIGKNPRSIKRTVNSFTIINNVADKEKAYHYTVINENGQADSSVVTVSDSGLVTAVGNGTAIVLVTYDAININGAAGGPFFGAIWPENTGVFVVSVGAQDSGITTGMTINETINAGLSFKNDGTALDAEHDVIYFTGDTGSYTFTPGTAGVTVTVAHPTVGETMTFSGFTAEGVTTENGAVTVPLKEGRNIVKLEKDGKAEYQVITAKKVTVTINNGQPVAPGDTVSIRFSTVYHPINKLAGVYNYTPAIVYTQVEGYSGKMVGSKGSQYQFAATEAAQTVSYFMTTKEQWGSTQLSTGAAFTIPADYANDTLTLSGGTIGFGGWGSWAGEHRRITLESGKLPNLNAASPFGYLGQLPDIVIPVTLDKTVTSIEITTQPAKTEYFAGDSFDPTEMVVKATYSDDTTNDSVTSYTVSPETLTADTTAVTVTYGGKTSSVPVTVTQPKVTAIAITKASDKTSYTAGDVFDPTGMVVTATYENGKTAPVTSYTYEPKRTLTESDTKMTITYTGSDKIGEVAAVEQAITVAPAPVQPEQPKTVTVSFTLLGDSEHGEPTNATGTHTLKANNLETWISKTNITVPQGAKVIDVMVKALGIAGIPYENPTGNYVSSIRGLAEFTNGTYSGWMYTLNGTHPTLGVAEQTVNNGDTIVFHYTDDYTVEQGSEEWGGPTTTPATKPSTSEGATVAPEGATVAPEVTVKGDTAVATVTDKQITSAVDAVKDSGEKAIVIAPTGTDKTEEVSVELPKSAAQSIAEDTDAALSIKTDKGVVFIPNDTLHAINEQASGSNIQIVVAERSASDVTDKTINAEGAAIVEVTVKSGDKAITSFGGKNLTISIPAGSKHIEGQSYKVIAISSDGKTEVLTGKCVKTDGKLAIQVTTTHLTTFIATTETVMLFTDVKESDYYYDAVLWAFAKGITDGTSATTFSPAAG